MRDGLTWVDAVGSGDPGNGRFRDAVTGAFPERLAFPPIGVWRLRCLSAVGANRTGCLIRFGHVCIVSLVQRAPAVLRAWTLTGTRRGALLSVFTAGGRVR